MKIYDQLPQDTRELIGMWIDAEAAWRASYSDLTWTKLVVSREEALEALRMGFIHATIESDEATAHVPTGDR